MLTYFEHSDIVSVQGIASTTWFLAIIAVVLRFMARRMSKAGLWYDDYFMLIAPVHQDSLRQGFAFTNSLLRSLV